MPDKPLRELSSRLILRNLYFMVGSALLLVILSSGIMLWRLSAVSAHERLLTTYHLNASTQIDLLLTELTALERHEYRNAAYTALSSDEHPRTPVHVHSRASIDLAGALLAINEVINQIADLEQQFEKLEYVDTVRRLLHYHDRLQTLGSPTNAGNHLPPDQWSSNVSLLQTTAEQLRRLHIRDAGYLSEQLKTELQFDLWLVLGASLVLLAAGGTATLRLVQRVRRLMGLQFESDRSFRELLEAAPDAMVIVNQHGEIALLNGQAEQLFGYSRAELMGKSVETLIPKRYRSHHLDYRKSFFNTPQIRAMGVDRELLALRKDGSELPVEISLSHVKRENDLLVSTSVRDVSARKHIEGALQTLARSELASSDAFFRECIKSLSTAFGARYAFFALLEDDTRDTVRTTTIYANGRFVDNFSYKLKHTPCEEVLTHDKQIIPRGAMARYPKDEMLQRMKMDAYYGAPLISTSGKKLGLVVVGHTEPLLAEHLAELLLDVYATRISNQLERREAEQALYESERYNRTLFEQSPVGLALVRMNGELVDVNPAYASIIGRSVEEALGLTYWEFTPDDYAEQEQTAIAQPGEHAPLWSL